MCFKILNYISLPFWGKYDLVSKYTIHVLVTSLSSEAALFSSLKAVFIFITADFVWEKTLYSCKKLFIFRNISYIEAIIVIFLKPLQN